VLRSARVLGALGYSPEVLEEGDGISSRGTRDDSLFSSDVMRKLIVKMERCAADSTNKNQEEEAEEEKAVRVKVRERASRREVKQEYDKSESDARAYFVVSQMLDWYNQAVGPTMLDYTQTIGRRLHLLDTTWIEVELECGNYELSGVVKDKEGKLHRGYKLGSLRTLLQEAGILTQVKIGAIQTNDLKLCRSLLSESVVLNEGDLLIEDRGFLDGATLSQLKRERKVDVIHPLRSNMEAYSYAVAVSKMENSWQAHPTRSNQEIAFVKGVDKFWSECDVDLNACVIRYREEKKKSWQYIVLVTTDLSLSAKWIVRHYETRPEIEQDYQQLKSGGWQLEKLSSTRFTEIVWHLLSVVLAYSLYQLFANTQAGSRFARKTRRAISIEQMKSRRTHVIVYAGGYFEIFETLKFVHLVLQLSKEVQTRLKIWLDDHLQTVAQLE
jgi:hypothetical protein